ncbi:MAG: NAD-dependent epimerase/dehydratase family protein [Methanobacterium sp.]|jgi:nucleoside-diphosphate-sugar epimerase
MKIIITGGAGFVGRNLVRLMLNNGFDDKDIVVLDNSKGNMDFLKGYNIKKIVADLSKNGTWEEEFRNAEYVVNLAAQILSEDYDDFYVNNISSTKNIVECAKKYNVKGIIHFSSVAAISIIKDTYSKTKLEGENVVKNSGINYCIIRPSLLYGPTDTKNIGFLIDFAKKFSFIPIPGDGKWPRQPIYIDDLCKLVILFMENFPKNQEYNIGGKTIIDFRDMMKIILDELGGFKFRLFLPMRVFRFLMILFQKLTGNKQFNEGQLVTLTSKEIFPTNPWWDEFNINITSFKDGISQMLRTKQI